MNTSPIIAWCNRFIHIGFYFLFGIVPLLLTPWNFELFEYNKMMAVYVISSFIVTSWIVKMIAQKEIRITKTPLDIPIALFVTSQLVSTLFSIDPHVSWLGYYSRFNGGMWSILCYVFLFYAFISHTTIQNTIPKFLSITLMSAVLVAIYGVLERLGIDKNLWVQDVQNRVFSTLGQPNWLAAYLVALVPLPLAFALQQVTNKQSDKMTNKQWITIGIYSALSLLFFVVLLFTRSRSGLFGFIVADIVFWGLILLSSPIYSGIGIGLHKSKTDSRLHGNDIVRWAGVLHLIFALIVFINGTGTPMVDKWITFNGLKTITTNVTKTIKTQETTPPTVTGPALETGGTESGTIRKYVWQGAINAWKSTTKTILIGTGTETFAFAFYQFRPVGHNMTSEWDFLYNKAHNEYLNYLATTGVFGLGSYLTFIAVFVYWFISGIKKEMRAQKKDGDLHDRSVFIIQSALFAGWLSILVTNFFGFSVVILQVFLFLFPAIIFAIHPTGKDTWTKRIRSPQWMIWLVLVVGVFTLLRIATFWYADSRYAMGYRQIRAGIYGQAIPSLQMASALNPNEPTYHDELGSAYATLSVASFEANNATQASQLASLAVEESDKAMSISPRNVNFYKTRTKIYYTLSTLEPAFNTKAIDALSRALTLSPNDPKIYYNLAILVGRNGEPTKAISYLIKAKQLKPNYRDAYYALWVFYTDEKRPNDARKVLEEYLNTVDSNDKDFIEKLK